VASAGRLKIKVYGGGELVPPFEVFDAVSRGTVEMGHDASYYHKGKLDAAQFFCAIPFGLNYLELNGWLYYGGGLELWRELYAPFNLVPFPCASCWRYARNPARLRNLYLTADRRD
jgi:TRAP-type mannitol/chloroaromatic compound transport system substrate-binding protein